MKLQNYLIASNACRVASRRLFVCCSVALCRIGSSSGQWGWDFRDGDSSLQDWLHGLRGWVARLGAAQGRRHTRLDRDQARLHGGSRPSLHAFRECLPMTAGIPTLSSSNSKPHASLWPYDGPMMAPKGVR